MLNEVRDKEVGAQSLWSPLLNALRAARRMTRSDVSVIAGGQLLQQALGLVTGVIIGQMIGAAGYGLVNLVRNILTPLQILAPLGLDVALLKHLGRWNRDLDSMHRVLRRLRLVVFAVNLPVAIVTGLGAGHILMGRVYRYPHFDVMLLITLLALPLTADIQILGAYYRSRGRPGAFALITLYLQPLVRLTLVGAAFLFARSAEAIVCIGTIQVAVSALGLWISFGLWQKQDAQAPADATPARPVAPLQAGDEWRAARTVLGDSIWMSFNLFVYGMMRYVDVLVLGAYVPAAVVGSYTALASVAQLVSIWPIATSQTLGPDVSRYYHAGDHAALRKVLNDYIHFASVMSAFLFGGVAAFGDHLDLLFGHSFHFRPLIAFLMPLGALISATLAPMGFSLSMTGRHRAELVILIIGAAFLWSLCYLLVPRWGDVGAATAVCLSFALVNLIRFLWVGRTLGFIPGRKADLAPPVIAALLAFAVKFCLVVPLPRILPALLLGCVVYALAYAGVAYRFLLGDAGRAKIQALKLPGRA
jgi:O-antigen/teichoic acid export membrane protein